MTHFRVRAINCLQHRTQHHCLNHIGFGTLSRLRDPEGNAIGTFGISKDITQEKQLARELVQSQKFAAIGQAVTGIQHAIKNMLNSLKGGAYLVRIGMAKENRERIQKILGVNITGPSDLFGAIFSMKEDLKTAQQSAAQEVPGQGPIALRKDQVVITLPEWCGESFKDFAQGMGIPLEEFANQQFEEYLRGLYIEQPKDQKAEQTA